MGFTLCCLLICVTGNPKLPRRNNTDSLHWSCYSLAEIGRCEDLAHCKFAPFRRPEASNKEVGHVHDVHMGRLHDCDQWLLHRELMTLPGLPPETGIGLVRVRLVLPSMVPYSGPRKSLVLYLPVLKLVEACVP